MDQMQFLYSHGRLICIGQEDQSILLQAFRLDSTKQLSITVESKVLFGSEQKWMVHSCAECIDRLTGDLVIFLLASRVDESSVSSGSFTLLNVLLDNGTGITCRRQIPVKVNERVVERLEILTWAELPSDLRDLELGQHKIFLIHGPCVLFLKDHRLNIIYRKLKASGMSKQVLTIFRAVETEKYNVFTSKILCLKSNEHFIITVLLIQQKSRQSSDTEGVNTAVSVVALERADDDADFVIKTLPNKDFFLEEYAVKISAALVKSCQKKYHDKEPLYETECVLGLTDGYILFFHNGDMQACILLKSADHDCYHGLQSFAVEHIWAMESAGVLICYTSTKECFALSMINHKVHQSWSKVKEVIVGDFLQHGGSQLLMLFDDWSPQQPETHFLLTDLQGFVLDKRYDALASRKKSETSSQQQQAFSALTEQNQILVRHSAEEEQRLVAKNNFLREHWQRLQIFSVCRRMSSQDLPQAEVPLVPLVGTKWPIRKVQLHSHQQDIEVTSVWHKIIDSLCVVGVSIVNTSTRLLKDLHLSLHTRSAVHPSLSILSSTSKIWHFCDRELPSGTKVIFNAGKRLCVEPQLLMQQTDRVLPAEGVTVTCMFQLPPLGQCGDHEYVLHLHVYLAPTDKPNIERQSLPAHTVLKDEHRNATELQPSASSSICSPQFESRMQESGFRGERRVIGCGTFTVKLEDAMAASTGWLASLQQNKVAFKREFKSDFLAMAATQSTWHILVTFHLHDPSVIKECIEQAGLVYVEYLGHYIFLQPSVPGLYLSCIAITEIACHPKKEALLLVSARDSNQMLLLLRRLCLSLPDDATISSAALQRQGHHFRCLLRAMSAEQTVLKKQLTALLQPPSEPWVVEEQDIHTAKPFPLSSELEMFVLEQKQYWEKHESIIKVSAIQAFYNVVREWQEEVDIAMAKFCLKT